MIPSNSSVTESALGFRLWLQFQFVADFPSSCSLQVTAAAQAPCPHGLQLTSAITLTSQCSHPIPLDHVS